ncbi:MAG: PTS sugar transporter subunit IIA [Candidatus Omnitrophica bacterium]|nr:PTS sugar transporter subunit IIA [Candidatus Omnitrophota bacterium]MDD5652859.1 PTS sugar transporter subunit IIA [Candidatus Omnitrophota bacterium]
MALEKNTEIRLSEVLKEKFIELGLQGKTKKEILVELVDLIGRSKKLKNKKMFLAALMKREALGSTGIGSGVAIPHAKSDATKSFILAFGRKQEGIDFGALDGERTYLFFVLASPEKEVGAHLKILAEISRLVKDKYTVELLKKAKDKKEILKIISLVPKAL